MAWLPKQSVVVPVDFSDESIAAVDAALALVEDAAHLHIIHVLPIITDYEAGLIWNTVSDQTRTEHAQLAIRERLSDPKYEKIQVAVSFGDAGTEIAGFAENKRADLIVIPSHGRTGLKRLLIGSVAERVVRLAHCPVLVLKPAA